MPIIPPGGVGAFTPATSGIDTAATKALDAAGSSERSNDFGKAIDNALTELQDKEMIADQMARDAATGKLQNIEDYMLAATDAQLTMELTVAVRDRAVEAFNDIMRMQV